MPHLLLLLSSLLLPAAHAADLSDLHRHLWGCVDQPTGTADCITALSNSVANQSDRVRVVFGGDSMIGETADGIVMLAQIGFEPFQVAGLRFPVSQWKMYVLIPAGTPAWTAWKSNQLAFGVAKPVTLRGQYRGFVPSTDCPIGISVPCVMVFALTEANPAE